VNRIDYADAAWSLMGAVIISTWPGIDAMVKFPILGIPIAALAAAMLGSGFSYLSRKGQDVEAIPLRLFGIAADAFLGGWIAVALFHATPMAQYGVQAMPIEAIAGLCAFLMQVTRQKTAHYFERVFQAGLNAWVGLTTRGKTDGEAPP
jgi:hypothetical protein